MTNRLDEAIYARDITVGQLHYMSDVSKSTISKLINNKHAGISMEAGMKICKALKADPSDIFIV